MQIVIDIPNPPSNQKIIDIPIHFCGGQVVDAGGYGFEERKTGRWISDNPFVEKITFDESGCVSNSCHCSECGDWLTASDEYPCRGYYCPNCGAKMEVDE